MKVLEYLDLDTSKVRRQYQKVVGFLEKDDFHSAEVKKLAEHDIYRAKLDDSNRLLFKIALYGGVRYALIIEVVLNHAYDKSKFLGGAHIDESKIPQSETPLTGNEKLPSLVYLNPSGRHFHFLDKIISFSPEQEEAYHHTTPLIIIGPAGSGKTALILEKMKRARGQILYVTLSPYLADNSRNIYFAHHYGNDDQEVSFLSFKEFLETMRVPEGREITYVAFSNWLQRFPRQRRVADGHRLYEEFRGVITGSVIDKPWLDREDYLNRGIRQSIYRSVYDRQSVNLITRYQQRYASKFYKDILRECELYGVDHRNIFNKTPLMLAANAGNSGLIKGLLEAGADTELTDNYHLTAWQSGLQRAMKDSKFASEAFPGVHEMLAPSSVSLKIDERLIKIDSRLGEFLLFHIFFATLRSRINRQYVDLVPFTAVELAEVVSYLPDSVMPEYRKRRSYISALLSKNEVDSANPYCRKLFKRKRTGHYILNPKLAIRVKDNWMDVYSHIKPDIIPYTGAKNDKYFLKRLQILISEEEKDLF
jgi:hypothetical protein